MFCIITTNYRVKPDHEIYFFPHNIKWIAIQITLAGIKAVNVTLIICEQLDFLSVGKIYRARSFGQFEGC